MAVSGRKQPLTRSILQGSNEDMPVCSPCENGGSLIEAHGFCSNCKEHLCEACYKSHLRPKLFRNHVLLDKSLMPREVPAPDDICTRHPVQQLEYYCRNHDKMECSKCVNIYHRTCDDVSYIQYICDDIEDTKEFKTLYKTITGIEHDVVQNEAKVTTNLTNIQTNVNETKTSIRRFRKYLDQQLDKMEEALCEEADDIGALDKEIIENVSDECNTLASSVRAVIYNFDVARKTQQKMRMFITLKNTQRLISGWQKQLDDIASKNTIKQYKFEPEKRLQSLIGEGHKLGRLVMKDSPDPGVAGKTKAKVDDQVAGRIDDVTRPYPSPLKGTETSSKRRLNPPQDITADKEGTISVEAQSDSKRRQNTPQDITADKEDTISVEAQSDSKRRQNTPQDITADKEDTISVEAQSGSKRRQNTPQDITADKEDTISVEAQSDSKRRQNTPQDITADKEDTISVEAQSGSKRRQNTPQDITADKEDTISVEAQSDSKRRQNTPQDITADKEDTISVEAQSGSKRRQNTPQDITADKEGTISVEAQSDSKRRLNTPQDITADKEDTISVEAQSDSKRRQNTPQDITADKEDTISVEAQSDSKRRQNTPQDITADKEDTISVEAQSGSKRRQNTPQDITADKEDTISVEAQSDSKRRQNTPQDITADKEDTISVEAQSGSKRRQNTPQDITADKEGTISVEAQSDSKICYISGSVRIDDNALAVTDYNNASIKMMDLNRKKVNNHLSLKYQPWDITRVNEDTLAVTCPYGEYIQLVRVSRSGSLTLGQQIQVGGKCRGICYIDTGGGRLVISFTDPDKVKVMDMSGTVLKDLSFDSACQPRFDRPAHITISNDGNTLIVSNAGTDTVTGLTLDGAVKFTYKDDKLSYPRGVAVGDGSEIYVCGWLSDNIHVISSEGRKINVLLENKDGVAFPESITYSDNKLYVGSDKVMNHVDVYRIRYQ